MEQAYGIYMPIQLAGFVRLSKMLEKIPEERRDQIDERAAIFVAGMEAAERARQSIRPTT